MQHIDIEKQIQKIRESLDLELKRLNAIDESGRATDQEAFDRVIDEKIREVKALEPFITDESGVAKDRYSANIFFHQIELLNEMRKNHTINVEPNSYSLQQGLQNETKLLEGKPKKQMFKEGIKNLIQKFTGRRNLVDKFRE